ncbi:PorV/PorQ family protein [Aureispira sp. CCB-E]|uniref:putative type IX sorting system protein PorV2 n=1 Tax=Aureispira sp. CCB-E TaxID=3051121 RepID=UPI002868C848|nr:PorV/PorQ family protein [Aureispira sp. CCB-E]WMX14368.1 PorV/PorQ family protein [Aureispira sp. CCB-E]
MLRLLFIASAIFALVSSVNAQKYSNEFLSIGVGARAQAMAGAQIAQVNDATAGFWNPAGLTGVDTDLQLAAMHNEWFASIGRYDYVGLAAPIMNKAHYLGFTFIRFGVDNIPNTLTLYEKDGTINYNNVTTFNAADYAFMLHYAKRFESLGLSVGVTPKVVHRKIGPFATSWGFGIDIGAQYRRGDWQFGLMLKDISTTFNAWSFNFTEEEKQVLDITGNDIPVKSMEITRPTVGLGVAYHKDFKIGTPKEGKKQKYIGLTTELDFNMTTDGRRNVLISADPISFDPALGLELHYNNLIFLRGGINNIQQFKDISDNQKWAVQPNFGVGFRIYKFYVDYALGLNAGGAILDNTQGAILSHIVSIKIDISFKYIKNALKDEE